jgi:hypothetical protein
MNIHDIVILALEKSQSVKVSNSEKIGILHRERSKQFVESLSQLLLVNCSSARNVASLSKHHSDDRERFGMNELLFDVTVVEFSTVHSGTSGKELSYVTKGIWIVESELAKNKREALYDFNKLVLGNSENMLFVGPHVSDEDDFLRVLGEAAKHCSGTTYVSLIPHPEDWPIEAKGNVSTWVWERDHWRIF